MSQVAAKELGINPARISVRHGDIESTASDFGTPASHRTAMSGGAGRAPAVCKKGMGESGTVAAAAIANAVRDALSSLHGAG